MSPHRPTSQPEGHSKNANKSGSRTSHGKSEAADLDGPCLDMVTMADPKKRSHIPLIAFYYPGREEVWDRIFNCSFLGNFYDLGQGALSLSPPEGSRCCFRNAEAAFQATKFWRHAHEFANLSGGDAFAKKKQLFHSTDLSYSGYGSNWQAMLAVLRAKFQIPMLAAALLRTKDAFLLEHNAEEGRDKIWSDNRNGEGKNWLGLQLMLVRDELRQDRTLTAWIRSLIDVETGKEKSTSAGTRWQNAVREATHECFKAIKDQEDLAAWEDGFTMAKERGSVNHQPPRGPVNEQPRTKDKPAVRTSALDKPHAKEVAAETAGRGASTVSVAGAVATAAHTNATWWPPSSLGECLSTVSNVILRKGESKDSEKVCTLFADQLLEVLALGSGGRLCVRSLEQGGEVGWLSIAKETGERLVRAGSRRKDDRVAVTIEWPEGGDIVYLSCSFFRWEWSGPLSKNDRGFFSQVLWLPRGDFEYKFKVDGELRVDKSKPTNEDLYLGELNEIVVE
mmetsp:Transcript_9191/g.21490  ORF Transcript_9191/g.21490 Transcript_9191/m.21490 type:complete len:507 (-) Transcript_9191:46-1566(-)|eukprot:CAMPEP_0171060528 /NCGR_PEP_ID=MMETSP0766_2-20121228/3896_1 /TAXON_ID=439317 /ORGANISM="Gambierdiscus australes, Strain CAWD 149" /LENGTH=506 /DNA_ID=CAMNT_0011516123 /DNA_START=63 /DNA_END=1583 /DNA_ORIENTATION=-